MLNLTRSVLLAKNIVKKYLINISLILAALCLSFIIIETLLRKTKIIPKVFRLRPHITKSAYQLSDNPVLGYELKPNFRSKTPDNTETFSYTNAFGQRDSERELSKKANTKRIIILGDSVVAGHGIADLNDTISKQLEMLLQPNNIEVLNFGVGGYSTIGEIELLKTKAIKFAPDIVILLSVHNDKYIINTQIENYVPKYLTLFQKAYIHLSTVRFICAFMDINPCEHILNNHYTAIGKNSLEKSMQTFKNLEKEYSFKACIMLWPTFSKTALNSESKRMQDIIDSATNHNIPFWDLKPFMQNHISAYMRKKIQKHLTVGDNMHPNKEGAKIAAIAIKDILAENFADTFEIK